MITETKKLTEYNRLKHEKAILRKRDIFDIATNDIGRLSKRDLQVIGVALYWAEGYKTDLARDVEIVNSDVLMIKLMMRWFREICGVREGKFKIRIQIHDPSNIKEGIKFWSLNTGIPSYQNKRLDQRSRWPHRLVWSRTLASQAKDWGSNPHGATKKLL